MIALVRLELAKLSSWRSVLYLVVPNLGALGFTVALAGAIVRGSQFLTAMFGSVISLFAYFEPAMGLGLALCLQLLCADLWCSEVADRSLRTLVLMQVPRGRLLAARVAVATGIAMVAWAIYWAIFFANAFVVRGMVAPAVWLKADVPLGSAFASLCVYAGGMLVGNVALVLLFTLIALVAGRPVTAALLSTVVLAVLGAVKTRFSEQLLPEAYYTLMCSDVMKGVIHGREPWGAEFARATAWLAVNAAVLWTACWSILKRKEFTE